MFPALKKLSVGHATPRLTVWVPDLPVQVDFPRVISTCSLLPSLTHIVSTSPQLTSIKAYNIDTVDGTYWRAFTAAIAKCPKLTSIEGLAILSAKAIRRLSDSQDETNTDPRYVCMCVCVCTDATPTPPSVCLSVCLSVSVLKTPVYDSLGLLKAALDTNWNKDNMKGE